MAGRWLIPLAAGAVMVLGACSSDDAAPDAAITTPTANPRTTITSSPTTTATTVATVTAVTTVTTAGPSPTSPATATEDSPARDSPIYDFGEIGPLVADFVAERGLDGAGLVIVERAAGIVHEEYWGSFGHDRVSYIASSSKMLTAGVLLRVHEDGLLDLDAPLTDAVDWADDHPTLTARQLVSNSSGLVGLGPNPAYLPYLCQWTPTDELEACAERVLTTDGDDDDVVPPDTEFRYGGAQWQVAGGVAEAVSGRSWAELIDEIYVEPCGVDSLGYGNHFATSSGFDYPTSPPADQPPTDNPNMEGGAFVNPPDYARLLLMQLRDGECADGRVLPETAIDDWHLDHVARYGGAGDADTGYGMGWWHDRTTGVLTDPGAYGSYPWLDVAAGFGAYLVVEADGATGFELGELLRPVVRRAIENET